MTKIEFYSLYGYSDSNIVKVKREGYTDGKYQYYKLGSVWFAIVPGYGASIAEGKTRKEAQAKAHEKTEALKKILETNGEKLRERFLDAPTQEEIEHNARVAEEQHTETEEETAEEITETATEQEEEKENEPMTTTYNITYNAQYDSHEVTFESKPATAVLDALKALKMRWNPKKACWYGFAKEHEIINAILENGEGETITGEKTEGATVYTDGYLGGGAVYGSKSNLHLYGADLSKAIREDIKRAGIKGVTVRCKSYSGGQSIGVTVTLRPDEYISFPEFLENYRIKGNSWIYTAENPSGIHSDRYFEMSAEEQQETRAAAAAYDYERLTTHENRVNEFYIDEETHFTPETLAKIKTIQAIICAYRYDESNGMVDYFDTNFYYNIYTNPAAVKSTTPDDEPTKPTKDEPKEEPAAEETAPVQPAEQAQEAESVAESVVESAESPAETENEPEPIPESAGDAPAEAPETAEPMPEPVKPSPIREDLARRAHEMISYSDYREGGATAEYNTLCDRAEALAEEQRRKVDPMYYDKIDALVSSYKRRMADNINRRNEIGTRCPSVLVAGPANFPVKKKLKQNAASDRNMEEYNEIQGILDKIRSTGTGGITTDDPNAREKIEKKIEALEAFQNTMKAVNAYYRKRGTLDGCPDITPDQALTLAAGMERDWRSDPKPFEAYQLSNNNTEIHRLRARLAELDKLSANTETGWTFDGGTVEICRDDNRVRIFHDSKPDADVISELKSNGFKWARSVGAWQRQLTENAINAARRITT